MKILYLSDGAGVDYMCDTLFHGLRSLFGPDVVDANRLWYLYNSITPEQKAKLYGKGFTIAGLIEEGEVDREDLLKKIQFRFYDLVIYGSVQRNADLLYDVIAHYPRERVLFVDGEDQPLYLRELPKHGLYFKRELHSPQDGVYPIQFGIPEEKCIGASRKSQMTSFIDPMNPATYIYDDERKYYDDYRKSLFARTMKKAGWDCMRHYEILACESIPYFENIEHCPLTIMVNMPKADLIMAKTLIEYHTKGGGIDIFSMEAGKELWSDLNCRMQKVLREKLTTKALAQQVVDTAMALMPKKEFAYA